MTLSRTDGGFVAFTVLTAVACFGLLVVLAGGVRWALDYREIQTAADLSAVAGANALGEGDSTPCIEAASFASANRTHLEECIIEGKQLTVKVSRPSIGRTLYATSKAGPDSPTDDF
jgi:secretion/DNA translocation related TadE-like protein